MYKLVITEELENTDYENQMKEARSNVYGTFARWPFSQQRNIEKSVLSVELTKEEWESVKKAIIEIK